MRKKEFFLSVVNVFSFFMAASYFAVAINTEGKERICAVVVSGISVLVFLIVSLYEKGLKKKMQ